VGHEKGTSGSRSLWNTALESLDGGSVLKLVIFAGNRALSFAAVLDGWRTDARFRACFNQLVADAPFAACFWETPPVTRRSLDQAFECVLVDSPALARVSADRTVFASYFDSTSDTVIDFTNLGGDALLVAPCPQAAEQVYPHLAAFVRNGPAAQQQALWQRVGECVATRLSDRPLWVSTSGLGVYWLHVRLDSFPKYYTWRPYTQI
jgi:hypothetical protein